MAPKRTIVVPLKHPDQLFVADDIRPSSSDYTEFTAQPAMDTVRDLLLRRLPRKTTEIEVQVILPNDQVRTGLADELTIAARRWVKVQNTIDAEVTGANGPIGRRLFLLGLLAFMVLQSISIVVRKLSEQDGNNLPLDAIAEALSVSSWVMLWFPVQIVSVEAWRSTIRSRRMDAIERLTVTVTRSGDLVSD